MGRTTAGPLLINCTHYHCWSPLHTGHCSPSSSSFVIFKQQQKHICWIGFSQSQYFSTFTLHIGIVEIYICRDLIDLWNLEVNRRAVSTGGVMTCRKIRFVLLQAELVIQVIMRQNHIFTCRCVKFKVWLFTFFCMYIVPDPTWKHDQ